MWKIKYTLCIELNNFIILQFALTVVHDGGYLFENLILRCHLPFSTYWNLTTARLFTKTRRAQQILRHRNCQRTSFDGLVGKQQTMWRTAVVVFLTLTECKNNSDHVLGHKLGGWSAPTQIPSSRVRMLPFEETNFYQVVLKCKHLFL